MKGQNDLETWCKVNRREELLLDWDYDNNFENPDEVAFASCKYANWKCHICGHTWSAIISNRSRLNRGCPVCGKSLQSVNTTKARINLRGSLAETHPDLAKEWHPTKNGDLTPDSVMAGSNKKVWWYMPYDDPKTGKHFDFEWEAYIGNRALKGSGCPFLSGSLWKGFNDLCSINPALAKEWNSEKNGMTPDNVSANDNRKFWWKCSSCGCEWEARLYNRNILGRGCPECGKKKSKKSYRINHVVKVSSLAESNPELAAQWHPYKNGNLKPEDVSAGCSDKVWWYLPYVDKATGKKFDFEWQATIASRNSGVGCPFLGGKLWKGFNDLTVTNPDIVKYWNYKKNKKGPDSYTKGSQSKVWWIGECGHEFYASVAFECRDRFRCPICSRETQTSFPEQAIYYYVKKIFPDAINGDRTLGKELDIYIPSKQVAIEYDGSAWHKDVNKDIEKDRKCEENNITLFRVREKDCKKADFTYSTVFNYSYGDWETLGSIIKNICSSISDGFVDIDINRDESAIYESFLGEHRSHSVAAIYPELIPLWDAEKNGKITLQNVLPGSDKFFWWKDGYGHEFRCQIKSMVRGGNHCPYCTNRKLLKGFNDLRTKYPEIADEWDYSKNHIFPSDVIYNKGKYWFTCRECGNSWQAYLSNRTRLGVGCPRCGHEKQKEIRRLNAGPLDNYGKSFLEAYPELSKEWDVDKNLCPADKITNYSTLKEKYWWKCVKCGYGWQSTIKNRARGRGCPECSKRASFIKVHNIDTGELFQSVNEAAEKYQCSASSITNCCKGRNKTCVGYHWEYANEK